MFWCDVLSTLTLLYDISWVNILLEERVELTVPVNAVGVAVSYISSSFISLEALLVFAVTFPTGLVAHFLSLLS